MDGCKAGAEKAAQAAQVAQAAQAAASFAAIGANRFPITTTTAPITIFSTPFLFKCIRFNSNFPEFFTRISFQSPQLISNTHRVKSMAQQCN